ncbi:alpha/beta hydrolase [Paenibacillus sp. IHBB 10380]|uniref:alpha/beta hydrolase n=1 Tax=Paenibacillus sp. IHBB 10380 TaxID=1566358 RepID=UPI0005CFEE89|nr:alpha/beta hydrolase [Paenibacillus sp. IHBB 10380]AJS59814.1 hypothetical protein UB51_16490 [Paenibacillus sp. IHBB 10380]
MISFSDRFIRAALSVIGFPLSLFQTMSSTYQGYQYRPSGQMIKLNQQKWHVNVSGQGSPTIILESGMGGCSLDWCHVQPELAKIATVIAYDRSGFGWSNPSLSEPTCQQYVDDLRLLLTKLDRKPPFLLVGHSYGGMIMRLFAATYPEEVMGLVLVDSTHENRYLSDQTHPVRRKQREKHLKIYRLGYLLSPIAIPRLLRMHIGSKRLPPDILKKARALGYRTTAYKSLYSELLHTGESSIQLQQAQPLRKDLAVIVLSAGKQHDEWKRGQEDLLQLTELTIQIVVDDSWHSIQIHRPDVVIDSVKRLLNMS